MTHALHRPEILRLAALLLSAAVLTACGGGDATTDSADLQASKEVEQLASDGRAKPMAVASKVVGTAAAKAVNANSVSAPDVNWTKIATEGQSFAITGTQPIRYGGGVAWIEVSVAKTGTCSNKFFGKDPIKGVTKACYALKSPAVTSAVASPAPDGNWKRIAGEGESFIINGTEPIRFGVASSWVEMPVASSGDCTVPFFGNDPESGASKACYANSPAAAAKPGAGYYVDAVAGDDSNSGTTIEQPWKRLSKLTKVKLRSGEGMFLKCGSVWRESVSLSTSQLVDGAIIAGYGNCSSVKAVVSGADNFSGGWTKSGQIWSRAVPAGTPKIARLFIYGEAVRTAQWPNAAGSARGFAMTSTSTSPSTSSLLVSAADLAVLENKDIVNAPMKIRHGGAQIDAHSAKAFDSATGRITLQTSSTVAIGPKIGYVLQDRHWMLDAPGEFFHDADNNVLHVWPASSAAQSNINNVLVEGAVRDIPLHISNTANVSISDIGTVMARTIGMVIYNAEAAIVQRIDASNNAHAGLSVVTSGTLMNSNGTSVQSSSFLRNLVYGIHAPTLGKGVLKGNTVLDTGTVAYVGQTQAGIWSGQGTNVDSNVVRRSALSGIRFEGAGGSVVQNNVVEDSCIGFSDCGAIYTWNGPKRANWDTNQLSRIQGNTIARAPVNVEGSDPNVPKFNAGIYLDTFTAHATMVGNTVLDVPVGIFIHNTSYSTIEANKVALTSQAALWANMDQTDADYLVGNVVKNNQFVPVNFATGTFPATPVPSRSVAIWFWHKLAAENSITDLNNFVGNDIVQLNDPTIPVAWVRLPAGESYVSATAWTQLNPTDPAPRSPELFALYTFNLGSEKMVNGAFDSSLDTWKSYFNASYGSLGTLVYDAVPGCSANCAVFSPTSIHDNLISSPFNMEPGSMYRLGFQASYVKAGTISRPGFVRDGEGGGEVTSDLTSASGLAGVPGQTTSYEGFFIATSNASSTLRLASSGGSSVGFDNVSLKEVTGFSLSKPKDWSAYAYANGASVSVDCVNLGWPAGCLAIDVEGTPIALPTTLTTHTAKLFLRGDSIWRQH